jgi:hypothetical protein
MTTDQPPAGTRWVDIHHDVWTMGDDDLMHTPETRPSSWAHVVKKWGPLHQLGDVPGSGGARLVEAERAELEQLRVERWQVVATRNAACNRAEQAEALVERLNRAIDLARVERAEAEDAETAMEERTIELEAEVATLTAHRDQLASMIRRLSEFLDSVSLNSWKHGACWAAEDAIKTLTAEVATLRATIARVEALADEWKADYPGPGASCNATPNAWWNELRAALSGGAS